MAIVPDSKARTWVLDRPCAGDGCDAGRGDPAPEYGCHVHDVSRDRR